MASFSNPFPVKTFPINRGYGVATPDVDPGKTDSWNGRFISQQGERIFFWIENIEATFQMGGSTAQSRTLRQFFPHNMVQPSVMVTGRAPNNFQYNRIGNFIRQAQYEAVSGRELQNAGIAVRTQTAPDGTDFIVPTVELTVQAGITSKYPVAGRTIKGRHKAWKLEGYIKKMAAGGQRFNHAPQFQFEFLIAVSFSADGTNIGLWSDTAVQGDQIKPWLDIFKSNGKDGFLQPKDNSQPSSNSQDPKNDPFHGGYGTN